MKQKNQKFEPLAIVGMSCLFPKAQSLEDYWANIKEKIDAITEVPKSHWDIDDYYNPDKKAPDKVYAKTGAFLDPVDFNPGEWGIAPSDLDSIDTSQLLSLVVAQGALADAGYHNNREFNRDNVSVILGLTGTLELVIPLGARLGHPIWKKAMLHAGIPEDITNEVIDNIGASYVSWQENSFPGLLGNVAAGRIANRFDLGGTNCVVDAACGSALSALNLAAMELWTGKADMAITGGVDTFNDIFMYMCFCKTPALSSTGHARPFSEDNDGTILGEGIGMVVLKRLSDAEKDGDKIYALINAVGSSSDGKGKAIYAPSAAGQVKALRRAYEQAGITPKDVSLIEAHGTGTSAGDEVEVNALKEVYGQSETDRPWCAIGSVKSQIGHTKAAAGSAGLIKAALALYHKVIPPTIKVSKPAKSLRTKNNPFFLPNKIRPWTSRNATRYAAVSSLGFGGSNYHVVLSEYKPEKIVYDWPRGVELATISGNSIDSIKSELNKGAKASSAEEIRRWAAEGRKNFSTEHQFRLSFAFNSHSDDLNKIISDIIPRLTNDASGFALPNGVYFENETKVKPIGVIFPGQGSQYSQMGLDINCFSPEAFKSLEIASNSLGKLDEAGNDLNDYIYPIPAYDAEIDAQAEEKIRATEIAQPAIGAISIGQYKMLEKLGLKAESFAGHSYGELVGLCAAGAFDIASLAKISRKRGELMSQGDGDRGGMIAVAADKAKVEEILREEKIDLVVANHNSPKQVVLSGKTEEIARAQKVFKENKIRGTILKVAGAFHSSFVSDAAEPFFDFLKKQKISKPDSKVYANTTAEPYPEKEADIKKLLGYQLANQVRFVDIIEKMYADGIRTFIEIGPGGKMIGLIKAILEAKDDVTVIALDSSAGKRSGVLDLARVLAQLSAMGYKLDIKAWQNGEEWLAKNAGKQKPRLTFPICGSNYKSPGLLKKREELAKPAVRQLQIPSQQTSDASSKTIAPETPARLAQIQAPVSQAQPTPAVRNELPQVGIDNLRFTRDSLSALQMLQQQTADLHRRFLEGQELAQKTILSLISGGSLAQSVENPVPQAKAQMPAAQHFTPASVAAPAPDTAQNTLAAPVPATQPIAQLSPKENKPPLPLEAKPSADISKILLEVVSEKTGYPADMLNLDMDMEADLGIDSIKRVEIMSAMQERLPDAPVVQPDQLGKLRTLAQIISHLSITGETGQTAPAAQPAVAATTDIVPVLLEVVSEKTGYPADMLNLDMDMEADLGIDSIKRVEIMSAMQERLPDAPVVQPDQLGKLRTLAQIVEYLSVSVPAAAVGSASTVNLDIQPVLLEIVSEKTGYPADMLNLDMDMEADLGIDSIKRVEIMSAVQEKLPEAPVIQPDQLGRLRTLAQIIDFLAAGSSTRTIGSAPSSSKTADEKISQTLLSVIAEKTGYPIDMLNPDMDMEADLGIDSIKRVEILSAFQEQVPDAPVVQPADLGNFRTISQIIDYLNSGKVDQTTSQTCAPAAELETSAEPVDEFPIRRTILVARELEEKPVPGNTLGKGDMVLITEDGSGLSEELAKSLKKHGIEAEIKDLKKIIAGDFSDKIMGFVLLAPLPERNSSGLWNENSEEFLKDAFMATQKAGIVIKKSGKGLIATVSRLDGQFALGNIAKTVDPVQGGLAGIPKTIRHEWPEICAKAIDIDYRFKDSAAAAEKLVTEILGDGPVEVGLTKTSRFTLVEEVQNLQENPSTANIFKENDVIVITGGARGVTAATAIAMAGKYKCKFALVGRSQAPEAEPSWLRNVVGEKQIKEAILKNSKEKMTPKLLESEYKSRMRNREILQNLAEIEKAGGKVRYFSADIRDQKVIDKIFEEIRRDFGPISGFIHGAGVLRDKRIEEKTRDQLDDVLDTKVAGLRVALKAMSQDSLKAIILFSSFSGRYGRKGQVDYSMANEVLNKVAQKLRILRPETRTIAFNWGPWDGGMVTPGLRNLFISEGIGLISLRSGAYQPIIELSHPETEAVEIGIIGEIPADKQTGNQGGTEAGKKPFKAFDYELSLDSNAWLKDHVINGDAVLPMAVIAEMLIHVATMHNPGLDFIGYNDLRILKGVVLKENLQKISFWLTKPEKQGNEYLVKTELRTEMNGTSVTNARATILLCENAVFKAPAPLKCDYHLVYPDSVNEAYENHLFHGNFFRTITKIEGWSKEGISAICKTALPPENWSNDSLCTRWYSDPLAVDGAFQLMILWTTQSEGAPSLPGYAASYRQFCTKFPEEVIVRAAAKRCGAYMASADIDFLDKNGQVLARMEGYECTINDSLREAFKLRKMNGAG
ncbi:MAG: type I polyketide synthase [Candidatus Rifleibacteriota bacterium]